MSKFRDGDLVISKNNPDEILTLELSSSGDCFYLNKPNGGWTRATEEDLEKNYILYTGNDKTNHFCIFKKYTGFTEEYEYCTICDKRRDNA